VLRRFPDEDGALVSLRGHERVFLGRVAKRVGPLQEKSPERATGRLEVASQAHLGREPLAHQASDSIDQRSRLRRENLAGIGQTDVCSRISKVELPQTKREVTELSEIEPFESAEPEFTSGSTRTPGRIEHRLPDPLLELFVSESLVCAELGREPEAMCVLPQDSCAKAVDRGDGGHGQLV
jgi:hypothetical protein